MSRKAVLAGWLVDGSGEPAKKNVLLNIENGKMIGRGIEGQENLAQYIASNGRFIDHIKIVNSGLNSLLHFKAMAQGALRNLNHQLEQISQAKALGVPIAVGTDSGSIGVHHGPSLSQEIGLLVTAGFSIEESIQCACANGAELLDLKHCGRLEKGMEATFIAVNGPPDQLLENLASTEVVVIKGKRLKSASKR